MHIDKSKLYGCVNKYCHTRFLDFFGVILRSSRTGRAITFFNEISLETSYVRVKKTIAL